MVFKYHVGDKLRIIECGYGYSSPFVGREVIVTERGRYGPDRSGYKCFPELGNEDSELIYNGEESFELVESAGNSLSRFYEGQRVRLNYIGVQRWGSQSNGMPGTIRSIGTWGIDDNIESFPITVM
jgi:hypothetical protein